MATRKLAPIHPGEILQADFLEAFELSQYRLAQDISVPARRINEIVHGKRGITADTALRLARYFGTSDRFWLNLQPRFDLETQRDLLGARLEQEVHPLQHAS
jgi:addiction module HigA family antidote